jgi:hypothetical protein
VRPLVFDGFGRVARFALFGAMSMSPAESDDTVILEASPRKAKNPNFRVVERTKPLEVARVYQDLSRSMEPGRIEGRLEQGLRFFAFSEGDRLVGSSWFVSAGRRFLDESGLEVRIDNRTIWVRDAYVDPAVRGRGLFGSMLDALVMGPFKHVTRIMSDVTAQNEPSLRAHYNYGFRNLARIHTIHVAGVAMRRSGDYAQLRELGGFKPDRRFLFTGSRFRAFVRERLA